MSSLDFELAFPKVGSDLSATGVTEGSLSVQIDGKRFWPPKESAAADYTWTWVDLLDHLSDLWPLLRCDADVPPALESLRPEHLILELARFDPAIDGHEQDEIGAIQSFLFQHDLAQGLPGARVPSLLIIPQGRDVWVGGRGLVRKLRRDPCVQQLERLGEQIAARLQLATDAHAARVLADWRERDNVPAAEFVALASGASEEAMQKLGVVDQLREFFGLSLGPPQLTEPLVVFRLTHRLLPSVWVEQLVKHVRSVGRVETPRLDKLVPAAEAHLAGLPPDLIPAEQGYAMAAWLRKQLRKKPGDRVNPDVLLEEWGVPVTNVAVPDDGLEAVAVWGPNHGPAVLINTLGRHSQDDAGRRASSAHEIQHLLVDRDGALPLADVAHVSHKADPEKRAGAFAAELLAPRAYVGKMLSQSSEPDSALVQLCERYQASQELVAWQGFNSGFELSPDTFALLKTKVSEPQSFTWEKMQSRVRARLRRDKAKAG